MTGYQPWSDYERAMLLLDCDAGQQFSAHLSDEGATQLWLLLNSFEPQQHGAWCGLAVAATALKALGAIEPPTQTALFEEALVVQRMTVQRQLNGGLSLDDLRQLMLRSLQRHNLSVGVRCVSAANPELLASSLDADLIEGASSASRGAGGGARPDAAAALRPLLLVNLIRTLGGSTTGHWVLVGGAVRVGGERWVLILDPAAHKCGPHWLPELQLIACMATLNVRGEPRGYLALESYPRHSDNGTDSGAPPRAECGPGRQQQLGTGIIARPGAGAARHAHSTAESAEAEEEGDFVMV